MSRDAIRREDVIQAAAAAGPEPRPNGRDGTEREVPWPWLVVGGSWAALVAAMAISRTLPAPMPDEASVYAALPVPVWLLLALAFVGFGSQLLAAVDTRSSLPMSALSGLIVVSVTLLAIPHLRGYEFFGRGDDATYLGTLQSLISTGRMLPDNFYPAATLVAYQVVAFAGVPTEWLDVVGRLLPLAVYVLGSVILARCILRTPKWDAFVTVASLLPLAGGYVPDFSPAGFGVALTPLVLATFLPEIGSSVMGRRARTLLLLTFAFIHPLGCLVLLGVAVVVLVVLRLAGDQEPENGQSARGTLSTGATLLAVAFAAWITPSILFQRQLTSIRDAILSGISQSPGQHALELANRARLGFLDFIALPIATNIGVVIAASAGLLACTWALTVQRRTWSGRRDRIAVLLGIELGLGLAFLVSLAAPVHLDVFRVLHFFAIIVPVLLATAAAVLGYRRRILSGALLISVGFASAPFVYASPVIRQPTSYVPAPEIGGVRWLLENNQGPRALPVTTLQTLLRDVDLAIGFEDRRQRSEIANAILVPDHFGDQGDGVVHLGNERATVLTVSVADVIAYTGVWSSANRINQDDFTVLTRDPGTSRIYSNDAIDVYSIQPDSATVVSGVP